MENENFFRIVRSCLPNPGKKNFVIILRCDHVVVSQEPMMPGLGKWCVTCQMEADEQRAKGTSLCVPLVSKRAVP